MAKLGGQKRQNKESDMNNEHQNSQKRHLGSTDDCKTRVSLMSRDGRFWLNQKQKVELCAATMMNICLHIANILKEKELEDSVVKPYLTTAA